MTYDNTNRGVLFKNDKQGNENRPDYRGSLNVAGVEFWISAWLKTSKDGNRYMSLSVQPKEERQEKEKATEKDGEPFNDDIPFAWAALAPVGLILPLIAQLL